MFEELAKKYTGEQAEHIRDAHKHNYDCWNKFKVDPAYTEDHYWEDIIKAGKTEILARHHAKFTETSFIPGPRELE